MEMEDGLACRNPVVLHDVQPVCFHGVLQARSCFFGQDKCFGHELIREFMDIGIVCFGNDQGVSFCGRARIENDGKIVIFVKLCGGNFTVCKFAENTV